MKTYRLRVLALCLCVCLLGGLFAVTGMPAVETEAASSVFTFSDGKMSKETLRAYCSRAVTFQGFCVENTTADNAFEDDLRMIQRIGAKYIGRAAFYSWGGNMSWEQIQEHYRLAKEQAAKAHKADPELILQAGVIEIIYKGTVNNTPIPAYVFEAFGQPVEQRNFRYMDMVFTSGPLQLGNVWGSGKESAVPNITALETRMYFYWQITQYIDAGYESIHLGQTTLMSNNNPSGNVKYWDELTTMCRTYAQAKARRGIILFDSHATGGGLKNGDRLILDIQAAPLFPEETVYEDGIYKCTINDRSVNPNQWIGNTKGGQHPLGFTVEENFTILEFDNYDSNGKLGVATPNAHYVWGYDDISWFALQPKAYRDQFIADCHAFLSKNVLDSEGKQQYFLQPACRRVLIVQPTMSFTIQDVDNIDYILDYLEDEQCYFEVKDDGSFVLTVKQTYRANNQSDACPNGFGQEDTIREIFLGKNYPEDPAYTGCVVPGTTAATKATTKATTKPTAKVTATTHTTTAKPVANTTAAQTTTTVGTVDTDAVTSSTEELATTTVTDTDETVTTTAPATDTDTEPDADKGGIPVWAWIAVAAVAVLSVAGVVVFLLLKKGKAV
ncbi:MAG: hypothetical protein IJZ13_01880 [Clostridia bacterium]|nr:hypothetical protein [Clostridia bacterium]